MSSEIIDMEDMAMVYEITDEFGIDRESITVDLTKEDPGRVDFSQGQWAMVLPLTVPMRNWQSTLKAEIEKQNG